PSTGPSIVTESSPLCPYTKSEPPIVPLKSATSSPPPSATHTERPMSAVACTSIVPTSLLPKYVTPPSMPPASVSVLGPPAPPNANNDPASVLPFSSVISLTAELLRFRPSVAPDLTSSASPEPPRSVQTTSPSISTAWTPSPSVMVSSPSSDSSDTYPT